jgi:hypothetical protein
LHLYLDAFLTVYVAIDHAKCAAIKIYSSGTLTKRPQTKRPRTKRPRMKRPMDFLSQKFCNETSLGQNGPWDKAVLGQNILSKFVTKHPHFQGPTIRL